MRSDKARTNHKWASNNKYRKNFDAAFGPDEISQEGRGEEEKSGEEVSEEETDRLRSYDYHCIKCDQSSICIVYYSERDRKDLICEHCGTPGIDRVFGGPVVLQASYPDGVRRKSESWRNAAEASKLNVAAAQEGRQKEKDRIKTEIKSLIGKQIDKGV